MPGHLGTTHETHLTSCGATEEDESVDVRGVRSGAGAMARSASVRNRSTSFKLKSASSRSSSSSSLEAYSRPRIRWQRAS